MAAIRQAIKERVSYLYDGSDFSAKVSRDKNQDLFEARVLEKVPGHLIFTRLQNICAPPQSLRHAVIQGTKTLTSESRF
jgi:hypothetical protein